MKINAIVALAELELNEHEVKYIDNDVKKKSKSCVDVIDKKADAIESDKKVEKPRAKLFEESCCDSFTHGRKMHEYEDNDKYKQQYHNINSDHSDDSRNHRLCLYTQEGKFLCKVKVTPETRKPSGVVLDAENRELYVLNLHGREAMTKYKINLRRN